MLSNSKVDVIVPCYRFAHLLRDCVMSVLDQPGVQVRVLVIDDASPDHTETVGRELASEDPRVQFRRHAKNLGHIATYNEGIEWTNSDYALLLSADDILLPGALNRAAKLMDEHSNVVLTYGRAMKTTKPDRSQFKPIDRYDSRVMSGDAFLKMSATEADNLVPTPTAIVRTSTQKLVGGYRADLPHASDLLMWLRFAAHGDVGFIDAEQAIYRIHDGNMSHQYAGVQDLRQRLGAFETAFDEYGYRLSNAPELRALARKHLAINTFWTASHHFDAGDVKRSAELIAFAMEIWPALRATKMYRRFKSKRMVGSRVWSCIAPVVRRLRQTSLA